MREAFKSFCGKSMALLNPQCRYEDCIFVLAHMRCGSTALSNILCSRPEISGYGEAHICYAEPEALGRLVVNQALRKSWSPKARHLFDKILHNRHDAAAQPGFFRARAVFLIRPPAATILSICKLYQDLGRDEYATHNLAADYYVQRLNALSMLWDAFPSHRRVGLTHDVLLTAPEAALSQMSQCLALLPTLSNQYESPSASRKGGGGDPTTSGKYTSIRKRQGPPPSDSSHNLQISDEKRREADTAYARLVGKFMVQ